MCFLFGLLYNLQNCIRPSFLSRKKAKCRQTDNYIHFGFLGLKKQNYSEGFEMDKRAEKNTSFAYSVNLLRMLLKMGLITDDEYGKIVKISAEHYGTEIICV